ncbi:hypothetical protein PQ469_25465 [Mucilaginibacter sp. KACC 22773]|uniref:hypothetical protein n=1 Tax=Mucilaginibacter sp. KACC 22773 TaxID=3025671 RepID=UPI0023670387|nr:hypothetical protein [Mucilaginibacter sp. KACC 22773]WDF77239.1 hypothetical protein PQ469_25465 [Mucilaginibacter sp. KACC 22773]
MSNSRPTTFGILGYHTIFKKDPPKDRTSLIRHLSKDILLLEIAGLNYRLSGGVKRKVDTTWATQERELLWFCGQRPDLFKKYAIIIREATRSPAPYIFSRQACLFAMEEIIQSDIPVIEGFQMSSPNTWEPFLLYMFSVNSEITKITEGKENEPINFETLSPKLLPLNESMLINDPLFIVFRGFKLMEYLSEHPETAVYLKVYFEQTYQFTYDRFIFEVYSLLMANKAEHEHLQFHYQVPENHPTKYVFDILSERFESNESFKLLSIRKYPFYKRDDFRFILTDQNHLLEKSYYQFINDFWFDFLKGKNKNDGSLFSMQDFKSIIGYFFESYVNTQIRYAMQMLPEGIIRTFDQLKIIKNKQEVELGDIYIRSRNRIFIAEVKSTSIYDNEKYGGNIDALYKNDRNKFFKTFGVDKVCEAIDSLSEEMLKIDTSLENCKKLMVWPAIIVNEKAFQTPFMTMIFNNRFKELLKDQGKMIHVYPLTLIHISELEQMEHDLHKNPNKLWDLLSANFNQKGDVIPPFYITLNRKYIRYNYSRISETIYKLLGKYQQKLD